MIFIYLCALSTLIINEESFRQIRAQRPSRRGVAANILSKASHRASPKGMHTQNLPRNTEECLARCQAIYAQLGQSSATEKCAAACTGSTQSECETSLDAYLNKNPSTSEAVVTWDAMEHITVTVTVDGKAITTGTKVDAGTTVTVTLTPDTGYSVSKATYVLADDDEDADPVPLTHGTGDVYTFIMPATSVDIDVVVVATSTGTDSYKLTYTDADTVVQTVTVSYTGQAETELPTAGLDIPAGTQVTLKVTAKDGKEITGITSDPTTTAVTEVSGSAGTYTFTMPSSALSLAIAGGDASASEQKYAVAWNNEASAAKTVRVVYTPAGGEETEVSSGDEVPAGTTLTITIEPADDIGEKTIVVTIGDDPVTTLNKDEDSGTYTFTHTVNAAVTFVITAAEAGGHRSNSVSEEASTICAALYSDSSDEHDDDDDDDDECSADAIAEQKKDYEKDFPDYVGWYQKVCECKAKTKKGEEDECEYDLYGLNALKYPVNGGEGKGYACGAAVVKMDNEKFGAKDYGITATGTSLILTNCEFTEVPAFQKDSSCISAEVLEDDEDKVVSAGYLGVSKCTFTQCAVDYVISSDIETTIRYCMFYGCRPGTSVIYLGSDYECSVSNSNFTECMSSSRGVAITAYMNNKLTVAKCYFHKCIAGSTPVSIYVYLEKESTSARSNAGQIGSFVLTGSAFESNTVSGTPPPEELLDVAITTDSEYTAEDLKRAVTVTQVTTDKKAETLITVNTDPQTEGVKKEAASGLDQDAGFELKNVETNTGNPDDDDDGFPAWAIAVIVVGAVVIIAAIVVVVVIVMKKKSNNKVSPDSQTFNVDTETGNATEMN